MWWKYTGPSLAHSPVFWIVPCIKGHSNEVFSISLAWTYTINSLQSLQLFNFQQQIYHLLGQKVDSVDMYLCVRACVCVCLCTCVCVRVCVCACVCVRVFM